MVLWWAPWHSGQEGHSGLHDFPTFTTSRARTHSPLLAPLLFLLPPIQTAAAHPSPWPPKTRHCCPQLPLLLHGRSWCVQCVKTASSRSGRAAPQAAKCYGRSTGQHCPCHACCPGVHEPGAPYPRMHALNYEAIYMLWLKQRQLSPPCSTQQQYLMDDVRYVWQPSHARCTGFQVYLKRLSRVLKSEPHAVGQQKEGPIPKLERLLNNPSQSCSLSHTFHALVTEERRSRWNSRNHELAVTSSRRVSTVAEV
eukprot:237911-Pelagomonas_calceolata.AAC.5